MARAVTQSNTLLSLDDAAAQLQIKRTTLSSYLAILEIPKHRIPSDRRSYLATSDLESITNFHESKLSSKVNPAFAGMTIMSEMSAPHTMERNTRAYVNEGYAGNDTIFKVVNYCITNGAAIPPRLYTNRTMQEDIPAHALLDKLDSPNTEWDGVFFREAILGWYLVTGNSFQYSIRKGTAGPPDELWTLEAQKTHPVPNKRLGITSYVFDDFEEGQNPIPARNIGHMRSWNPLDPIFGLSPLTVGGILADQQSSVRRWNLALLQNYAKPPGAWVYDGILEVNTRKKVKEALNNEMAGYRNAGKVPVLDGGFKWVSSMTPPSELDWLESQKYNAGQLANLYNIAPQLIGDTSASTYHNMEEAKAASYTEAIFPMLDKLYSLWNRWLLPMYPDLCDAKGKPTAYLYYDKTTVEVVQAVIQARLTAAVERANKSWMQGSCTLNEAREQQGLPPLPGGDVFRFGAVLVRASEIDKYAEQSLQTPAAPPLPVPENELDMPPQGNEPTQQGNDNEQGKKPAPKKPAEQELQEEENKLKYRSLKAWQDVDDRLEDMEERGITHLTWKLGINCCESCQKNSDVRVPVGQPFPSGILLPPQCDDCQCSVIEDAKPEKKSKAKPQWQVDLEQSQEDKLDELFDAQVTHVMWVVDGNPCELCRQNDGETVEVGDEFPSGDTTPPVHVGCQCTLQEFTLGEHGKNNEIAERKRKRRQAKEAYREFMEAAL